MAKTVNEAMTAIADSIRENAEKALGVNISGKLSLDEMPTAINKTCNGVYNMSAVITRDEDRGKVLRLANRLVDGEYERVVEIDSVVDTAISDFDGVKGAIKDYQVDVPSGTPTSEYGYLVKEACEKAAGTASEEAYNMGVDVGQAKVYEEVIEPLDEAVSKTLEYARLEGSDTGASLREKITFINNNIPNVYNTGVDDGKVGAWEECDKAISKIDSNLENTVNIVNEYIDSEEVPGSPWEKIEYLNKNVPSVYETGSKNGIYAWWLKFQELRELRGYQYAFRNNTWTDDIYEPVMPINAVSGQNHNDMFRNTWITDTKVPIYFKHVGATQVFNSDSLQTIRLLDVNEAVTYVNWFSGCTALININMSGVIGNDIEFRSSPLNKSSIQSIVNCLSSTVSGKTLTLNKMAVNSAFKINVDDENTYPVGSEYYTLRHSRDNWDFNYA